MKKCVTCDEAYPLDNFYKQKKAPDGHQYWCKGCQREAQLKRRHNMTRLEYDQMIDKQGGRCAICKNEMSKTNIDHCHTTNMTRAMLCTFCNHGLGNFFDNPEALEAAAEYVRYYREIHLQKG